MPSASNEPAKLLGALDQGTTSTRFIVFDQRGNVLASAQREHGQIMTQPGYVEHDAMEIWSRVEEVITSAMSSLPPGSKLTCIGITNQRETTVVWNRDTGAPYHNAIVWMDTRTQPVCDSAQVRAQEQYIRNTTGLPISPYFAATKIQWILDQVPSARADAERGLVMAGTIDSWLLYKLSGGTCHCTDVTNASRYMLMDLAKREWDIKLCELFRVPLSVLPKIRSSSEVYFEAKHPASVRGCRVSGVLGDQQSALVGQAAFHVGMAKNTYGTGLFMLLNMGDASPPLVRNDLITTVAYQFGPDAKPVYALEGSVAIGGALVQWLRDNLNMVTSAAECDALAREVEDCAGVYIVPAFSGLYAPYWRSDARGTITGLTRYANKRHICRAAIEATALQTCDVFAAMTSSKNKHEKLRELRVDGGMVVNNLLMQFQADVLGCRVTKPRVTETTALGCAYAAGLAVGVWKSIEEIERDWPGVSQEFLPNMPQPARDAKLAAWHRAIEKSLNSA